MDFARNDKSKPSRSGGYLRYGAKGERKSMVYGTSSPAEARACIGELREQSDHLDFLVCSHPGNSQSAGMALMLSEMKVGELWMHRPWNHSASLRRSLNTRNESGFDGRLKRIMSGAYALDQIALSLGVPVYEPFAGNRIGEFLVVSPDRDWYVHKLMGDIDESPEKKFAAQMILASFYQRPWISRINAAEKQLPMHRDRVEKSPAVLRRRLNMHLSYHAGCLLIAGEF